VRFSISVHSGFRAPPDALDLLWERLGTRHADTRFTRGTTDIRATWSRDAPVSMEQDEREELGRLTVLGIVREACERAPELKLDWYAVSSRR
jgi:hypothetical protein